MLASGGLSSCFSLIQKCSAYKHTSNGEPGCFDGAHPHEFLHVHLKGEDPGPMRVHIYLDLRNDQAGSRHPVCPRCNAAGAASHATHTLPDWSPQTSTWVLKPEYAITNLLFDGYIGIERRWTAGPRCRDSTVALSILSVSCGLRTQQEVGCRFHVQSC